MVVPQMLIKVVAHAGVEDGVHALLAQPVDVAVAQLGGEAGRVARDRCLTALVQAAAREGADHDLEPEAGEQRVPERQQLIHVQAQRQADARARCGGRGGIAVAVQQLQLVGVQVQILVVGLAGHGLVASVARDVPLAVRKDIDGQLAVVAAPLTLHGVDLLAELRKLLLGQHGAAGVLARLGLAVQRCAVSTHQTRDVGADDMDAHLLLKGAENGLVVEGAALHNDAAAQLLRAGGADDLVQRIFNDRDGQTGADVFNRGTVLLCLLDAGVHKDGAAAAEVHRLVGKQAEGGKLLDIVAQRLGEGLQKAAAAGGAGLVQEDVADGTILDLEALHVLTADVDDEVHIGQEVLGSGKVGHRLDKAAVAVEGIFDQLLTVAGRGHTGNLQPGVIPIQLEQRLLHKRDRVAEVGAVAFKQNVGVVVNDDQLDGGRAGVDADMHGAAVCAEGQAGHGGLHVAGVERLVLLLIGEKRRQAYIGGGGAVVVQPFCDLTQVGLLIGVECCAQRHKEQAVFRQGAGDAERFVKAAAQRPGEGQRAAQIQDIALDGASLRKAGDGLVDDCLIDRRCDIPRLRALIDEGLDVAFGKNAAAAGDRVGAGGALGGLVHLIGTHLQQGGHLVNEGAGAAGTAAVHAHLGAVGQKEDLCILAAQLNDAVGARCQAVGSHAGGKDLLHKGHPAAVG